MVLSEVHTQLLVKTHPATGEVLAELHCTPPQQVAALTKRAREAQTKWAALSFSERKRQLLRCADVISRRSEELARLISEDTGKPLWESFWNEIFPVVDLIRFFANNAERMLKPKRIRLHLLKYKRSYVHYAPRGVMGVISPWNFPFALASGDIFMALAAGNAVVHKGSEWTPRVSLEFPKILEEAGVDPNLVQVATGYGDVGAALVASGVDMVHFTGSVSTGRKIAVMCGERLLPYVLELGGKDAAIVLDDANVEHAARMITWGGFANAGQVCASVERVYATPGVYEPLVARITELVKNLRQGDGSREDVDVGPMIMPRQIEIVKKHVEDARSQGATIRTGGVARGNYYAPTVLTEVHDDMPIVRDETFGPVLPIMQVQSAEEAIRRANDSAYGLSAYVFTRNKERGRDVAHKLRAGTVNINDVLMNHGAPETPWGGVKDSGIGHTHSADGLRHMCEARHVMYSPLPDIVPPYTFPYDPERYQASVRTMRGLFGGGGGPVARLRNLVGGALTLFKPKERKG